MRSLLCCTLCPWSRSPREAGLAGREGKKSVTALLVSDALVMPRETLVLPEPLAKRPLQTGARDLAVAKHLSTLAASGKW